MLESRDPLRGINLIKRSRQSRRREGRDHHKESSRLLVQAFELETEKARLKAEKKLGILPYSAKYQDAKSLLPDDRVGGWGLPGHGDSKLDCGVFFFLVCLEVGKHFQSRLDGDAGQVFVKPRRVSCGRPSCPVCFESWAMREAHRIGYRFTEYRTRKKPIHVMASVPRDSWSLSVSEMRKASYKVLKKVGFYGGCCIYHPFRQHEFTLQWYFSPHFHFIGFGWVSGTGDEYRSSGWIVKNIGLRKSVIATAFYQLSHCGVWYGEGRKHSVTWFGSMSYNKLKIVPEIKKDEVCPLCGSKLARGVYLGDDPCPVDREAVGGEFWVDPLGWHYQFGKGVSW